MQMYLHWVNIDHDMASQYVTKSLLLSPESRIALSQAAIQTSILIISSCQCLCLWSPFTKWFLVSPSVSYFQNIKLNVLQDEFSHFHALFCYGLLEQNFIFNQINNQPTNQPTNQLTYYLTIWSRRLTGKLIVAQLINKFPAFYVTKMFIVMLQEHATDPYSLPGESSPHSAAICL
jgi:hypothetical protein